VHEHDGKVCIDSGTLERAQHGYVAILATLVGRAVGSVPAAPA
jgi:hypothetical protein